MSEKFIVLTSFVLVLGLILTGTAKGDLIGWWKFDEGSGNIAFDSSDYGNDGTLGGNPQWVAGIKGGALDLDGNDDYVAIDTAADDLTDNNFTLSAWIKTTQSGQGNVFGFNGSGSSHEFEFGVNGGNVWLDDGPTTDFPPPVNDDQWHFIAYVRDGNTSYIYVDGDLRGTDPATGNPSSDVRISIGQEWDSTGTSSPSDLFQGLVDDVHIYSRPLPASMILDLFNGIEPAFVYAEDPEPADGAIHEDTWVNLRWSPGDTAASHDVYLGENLDDVTNGTGDTLRGNQASTDYIIGFPGFPYPDGLVPGTTYYWRIDEIEADGTTKHEGNVWSFTVPPRTAYYPDPVDGAKYMNTDVELSWTAGYGSKLHTVYFGENFDDVNNATGGLPQPETTYTPGMLEMDKTYYWRVDEFDVATTHKGDVWSFSTKPIIAITDPNLIGWWTFDEGSGSIVLDFSGHGNDGKFGGDPQWVEGIIGSALELDGIDDHVSIDGVADYLTTNNFTLSIWIKTTMSAGEGVVFGSNTGGSHDFIFGVNDGQLWAEDSSHSMFPGVINDNQWHMITYVRNGSIATVYVDGVQRGVDSADNDPASETRWSIGQEWDNGSPSDLYTGAVDDARFYNMALTEDEVKQLMRGDPLRAWDPKPRNNSTVDIDEAKQPISWSAGDAASEHDVYFSMDKDAVDNADASDTTGIYRGRQGTTSYSPPEGVEWGGGPYYWRIDEYNTDATISKGSVWSFSVADFILVDDFEDYDTGENQIWYAWEDGLGYGIPGTPLYSAGNGTGSAVGDETTYSYTEETIVHGGNQSMPIYYDNNQQGKLKYSEVEKTLSSRRDWTKEGVSVLTIWFHGVASNGAESLYVALNGNAVVTHDNPNAAQIEAWTEWTIGLQAFADQGVNLTNVNTIAIGLGNKKSPAAGGSGTIYIDDIRLYRPAP